MKNRYPVRRPEFSRRRFLRGAGGATLALPALSLFQEQAFAQGTGVPKRLIIMFTPNGTLRDEWVTGAGESDFALGPILEPLEDLRERLLVLRGLEYYASTHGGASGHAAISSMLTGSASVKVSEENYTGSGISIDQYIAEKAGASTTFKSLPLGIRTPNQVSNDSRMSFSASGQAIAPENNPALAYDRLAQFIAPPTVEGDEDSEASRLLAKRRSAYSAVRDELSAFENYIAPDDRQKLEQHLAQVDELEAKVGLFGSRSCDLHPNLRVDEVNLNGDVPEIAEAQMELAIHALACDLTRVVTLQYSKPAGQIIYTWLGMERDHHLISHDVEQSVGYDQILQHDRWHAEQLGTLLRGLEAREAEDGSSLLDHTVVLWMTELAHGNLHSNDDIAMLLAGNLDGYFDTGRSLELGRRSNNDLYTTLLQGFGIDDSSFGDASFNEGVLTQLTA